MKNLCIIKKHITFQEKEKEVTEFYHKMADFYLFTYTPEAKLSGTA